MELSDKEWEITEPLLPELSSGKQDRPWRGNREMLDAILWVLRTGHLGGIYKKVSTVSKRYKRRFKGERFFSWLEDFRR